MLASAREMMGHQVRRLTLDDPECGFNVLDWIDTTSPHAATHIRSAVWWIAGGEVAGGKQSDASQFFKTRGHSLVACLLSHLLWSDELPPEERNLTNLRKMIATPEPEMRDALRYIHVHSKSSVARDYAGTLMGLVDETFSGVYANADEDTSWLANPAFAALVSGNSFRTTDITQGKLTVFIQIPLMALMHSPSVARVILGALLNAAYAADGNIKGRVLYLIDEAARLGTMQMLEEARDAGRKYGITLQLLYQEEAQLLKQWGREGMRAWFGGVSWRGYAAVQDPETAKGLGSVFGSYAVLATSEGSNKGASGRGIIPMSRSTGGNRNVHEIRRELIRPDELLADVRTDEMFVIPRNARPIRCGRAIYFRRPEMVDLVDENRFHQSGEET
jgi:type IV secretion system protein VirD4